MKRIQRGMPTLNRPGRGYGNVVLIDVAEADAWWEQRKVQTANARAARFRQVNEKRREEKTRRAVEAWRAG